MFECAPTAKFLLEVPLTITFEPLNNYKFIRYFYSLFTFSKVIYITENSFHMSIKLNFVNVFILIPYFVVFKYADSKNLCIT